MQPSNSNDFLNDFVIINYDSKDPNEKITQNNYIISKSLSKEKGNWSEAGLKEKLETNAKILSILQNSFDQLDGSTIKKTKKLLINEINAVQEHLDFIEKELEKGVSKSGRGAKLGFKLDKATYDQLDKTRRSLESIKHIVNTSLRFTSADPNVLKTFINKEQKQRNELLKRDDEYNSLKEVLHQRENELNELKISVQERVKEFDDKPIMGAQNAEVKEGSPRAGSSEEYVPPPIAMNAPPPPPPPGMGPPLKRIEKKFPNEPEPLDIKYSRPDKNNIDASEAKKIIEKHIEELKASLKPMNELLIKYNEANTLYTAFNSDNNKLLLRLKNNEAAAEKLAEDTPTTVLLLNKKNGIEERTFFRAKEWQENNMEIKKYNILAKAKKLPQQASIPEYRNKSIALAGIKTAIESTKQEIENNEEIIKTQKNIIDECKNTNCGQLSLKNDSNEFVKLLEEKNRRLNKWEQDLRRLNKNNAPAIQESVKMNEVAEDVDKQEKIQTEFQQFIESTEGMQEFINSSKANAMEMGGVQFYMELSVK